MQEENFKHENHIFYQAKRRTKRTAQSMQDLQDKAVAKSLNVEVKDKLKQLFEERC